jgi:hypothetical protein
MNRKTGSVVLIAGGAIMAAVYGIITAQEIASMVEYGDFVTNFMETLIPLLVFAGGVIEVVVGVASRKRDGKLAMGEIAPLIAAIVLALAGLVIVGLNSAPPALVAALVGAASAITYLAAVKK